MAELMTVKIEAEDIAERVLDEVTYKGKSIREWADMLTNPKTNGDRLRILSNEELAETFAWHMVELVCRVASNFGCDLGPEKQLLFEQNKTDWFDWLQSPADRGDWDG